MKIFKPSKSVISKINTKLLYAGFLGVISYMSWPTSAKYYGFGLVSICAGLAAAALAKEAIKMIGDIRTFEGDQEEFLAQGNEVKSSSLLAEDFMTEKGVIKDAK